MSARSRQPPVNIHDVLEHVRQLAQSGFAEAIEFQQEFDPSLPPVPGMRDQLIQAFLNLIKNASEAIHELGDAQARHKGRIVLRTAFRPGVRLSVPGTGARVALPLQIEVTDNGVGILGDMQKHLFETVRDEQAQWVGPWFGAGCKDYRRPWRRDRM